MSLTAQGEATFTLNIEESGLEAARRHTEALEKSLDNLKNKSVKIDIKLNAPKAQDLKALNKLFDKNGTLAKMLEKEQKKLADAVSAKDLSDSQQGQLYKYLDLDNQSKTLSSSLDKQRKEIKEYEKTLGDYTSDAAERLQKKAIKASEAYNLSSLLDVDSPDYEKESKQFAKPMWDFLGELYNDNDKLWRKINTEDLKDKSLQKMDDILQVRDEIAQQVAFIDDIPLTGGAKWDNWVGDKTSQFANKVSEAADKAQSENEKLTKAQNKFKKLVSDNNKTIGEYDSVSQEKLKLKESFKADTGRDIDEFTGMGPDVSTSIGINVDFKPTGLDTIEQSIEKLRETKIDISFNMPENLDQSVEKVNDALKTLKEFEKSKARTAKLEAEARKLAEDRLIKDADDATDGGKKANESPTGSNVVQFTATLDDTKFNAQVEALSDGLKNLPVKMTLQISPSALEIRDKISGALKDPITLNLDTAEARRFINSLLDEMDSGLSRISGNLVTDDAVKEVIAKDYIEATKAFAKNKTKDNAINFLAAKGNFEDSGDESFIQAYNKKRIKTTEGRGSGKTLEKVAESMADEAMNLVDSERWTAEEAIKKKQRSLKASQRLGKSSYGKTDSEKQKAQPAVDTKSSVDSLNTALNDLRTQSVEPIKIDVVPNVDGFYDKIRQAVKDQAEQYKDTQEKEVFDKILKDNKDYSGLKEQNQKIEDVYVDMFEAASFDDFKAGNKSIDRATRLKNALNKYNEEKAGGEVADDTYKELFAAIDKSLISSKATKGIFEDIGEGLELKTKDGEQLVPTSEVKAAVQSIYSEYQKKVGYEAQKGASKDSVTGLFKDMPGFSDIQALRKQQQKEDASYYRKADKDYRTHQSNSSQISDIEESARQAAKKAASEDSILSDLFPQLDQLFSEPKKLKIEVDASEIDTLKQSLTELDTKLKSFSDGKTGADKTVPDGDTHEGGEETKTLKDTTITPSVEINAESINSAIKAVKVEPIEIDVVAKTDGIYDSLVRSISQGKQDYQKEAFTGWDNYLLSESKEYKKALEEQKAFQTESGNLLDGIKSLGSYKSSENKKMQTSQFNKALADYLNAWGSKSAEEITKDEYEKFLAVMDKSVFDSSKKGIMDSLQPRNHFMDSNGNAVSYSRQELKQWAQEAVANYVKTYGDEIGKSKKSDKPDYEKALSSKGVRDAKQALKEEKRRNTAQVEEAWNKRQEINNRVKELESNAKTEAKRKAESDPIYESLLGNVNDFLAKEHEIKFTADLSQVESALNGLMDKFGVDADTKGNADSRTEKSKQSESQTKKETSGSKGSTKKSTKKAAEATSAEEVISKKGLEWLNSKQQAKTVDLLNKWDMLNSQMGSNNPITDIQLKIKDGVTGVEKLVNAGTRLSEIRNTVSELDTALRNTTYTDPEKVKPLYDSLVANMREMDAILRNPLTKDESTLGSLLMATQASTKESATKAAEEDIKNIQKALKDKGATGIEIKQAADKITNDGRHPTYKAKYKQDGSYKTSTVSRTDYTSGDGETMMSRFDIQDRKIRDASPMKDWAGQVKKKVSSLMTYYVSDYLVDLGMGQLREGYQFVKSLDSALTNISMTMNTSTSSLNSLGKSAIQTGVDLSTNASNVLEAVTIYANANETTDSILEKATPTLMLSNASGTSASNASNYLQAVVNQFEGMEGQEARIVNSYEKISAGLAMDFSEGISGMAEAVTNAGSVADEAGLDFETFAAVTGSIAEKTRQDFGSIGNTLKTTFARISRSKSADPDVTEKDRSQAALAYKEVAGIDLYDKKGQLKNMPDTLDELAAKWNELTDAQKNNVAEASAGTRGVNVFKAMISSWAEAQQLAKEAVEDTGFADTVQEKWENSLQGHTEKMKATMQGTFANVVDSGALDTIMSVGQGALGIIEKLTGAIGTLGGAINSTGLLGGSGGSVISAMLDGLVAFSAWNTVTNKKDGKSWGESISAGFAPFTQGLGLLKKGGKAGLGFLQSLKPYKDDQYSGWLKDENGEYITEYGEKVWGELPSQGGWTSDFLKNMKKSKEAFVKAKAEGKSMTESVAALGDNATVMQKTAARAGSVLSSTLGSTLAIGGLAVGGALLVNKLADDHQKEAANAGRAALQNYQTNQKTLRTNKSYTEAVLPRLTELQQGVNTRTGDNVSLTEAEFAEYNNIVNELGNMFPSLVTGYSRLGNSILNMGNTISGVSDQIDNQAVKFAKENIATADKSLAVWEEASTGNWLEQTAKKVQEFFGNDDAFDVDKNMVSSLGQYNVLQKALQLNKGQLKDFLEGKDIEGLDKFQRTMLNDKFGEGSMWTGKKIDTSNEQWYENLKSEMAGLQETLLPAITEATAAMRSQYLSQLDVARLDKELGVKGIPESTWDNLSTFLSGMSTEQITKLQQDNISPSDFVKSWTDALSGANFKDVNSALTSLLQLGSQSSFKEVENFANNGLKVLTDNIKGLDASSLYDMMGVTNFGKLDQARKDITKSYAEDYGRTDQYLKDSTEYMRLTAKSAESIQRASADQIREAGYNYEGGDSDMFTRIVRGYSKETEGMRAVVNPVLPDGTIMDKDTLADYVTDVLSGAREDEEGIILSAFKTKDAQKAAEAYKKKIDAVGKSLDKNANASKTINELLSDLKIDANEDSIYRLGEMLSRYGGDIEKLKRNWSADSWDYNAELERIEALKAKIEDVKEYYKSMSTARDEANSASGMSTDSIDYVKSMYSRLKGYNQEELFENTAMGVNLYAKAARNLHKEWKDSTAKEYQDELDKLCDTYATLNKQLAEGKADGKNQSNLDFIVDQIGDVSKSIDQVHQLQSQFEGVTNEVYEWQQAQSGSERGDVYDSMISGYKQAKELYEAGDIDTNKFRTFVNMLTDKDLTDADPTEVVQAYENSVAALDRWLGDDAYGNLNNFLDDLHGLGDDFARLDADDVWHLNEGEHSLKEIAKQLDISDAALNAIFGKLQDQGFDISYQDSIDALQQMREGAKTAQKELQKAGKVGDVDVDWNADSIDDLQKNIDKLEKEKIKLNPETDGDSIEQLQNIIDYFEAKQGIKIKVEMESDNPEAIEALTNREDRVNVALGIDNENNQAQTNYASSSADEYTSANQRVYEAIQKRGNKKLTSTDQGYSDTRAYVLDNIDRAFENTQQDAWWYDGFENQTQGFRDSVDAAKEMVRLKDKYSKMQEAQNMGLELDPKEFKSTVEQYNEALDNLKSHIKDTKLKDALKESGLDADQLMEETNITQVSEKIRKGLEANQDLKAKIAAKFELDESDVDISQLDEFLEETETSKGKYEILASLGLSDNEIEEYLGKEHVARAKIEIENEKGFNEFNQKYETLSNEQKEELKQTYNLDSSDLENAQKLLEKISDWTPGKKRSLLEFMGFDKSEADSLMQLLSQSEEEKKTNQYNSDYENYHDKYVGAKDETKNRLSSGYGLTGGETEAKFTEKLTALSLNEQRDALKQLSYSNEETQRMLEQLNPEADKKILKKLAEDNNSLYLGGKDANEKIGEDVDTDNLTSSQQKYSDAIKAFLQDTNSLLDRNVKERAAIADFNLHNTGLKFESGEEKKQYIDYIVGDDPTAAIEKKRLTLPIDFDFKSNDYKKKLEAMGFNEPKEQEVIYNWVEGGKSIEDMTPDEVEVLVDFLTKSDTFEGMDNEEIRKTIDLEIGDNTQLTELEKEKITLKAQLEVNGEASLKETLAAAGVTDENHQKVIIDFIKGDTEIGEFSDEHKQIIVDYVKGAGEAGLLDEETVTKIVNYILGDTPDESNLDKEATVDYVPGNTELPKPDPVTVDVEPDASGGAAKVQGALSKVSAPKINVEAAITKFDKSKIEGSSETVDVKANIKPDKSALDSIPPVTVQAKLDVDKSGLHTEPVNVQGHINWENTTPELAPLTATANINYVDGAFTPTPKTCNCTIQYIDNGWTPPQGLTATATINYVEGTTYSADGEKSAGTIDYKKGFVYDPSGKVATGTINYRLGTVAVPNGKVATGTINYKLGSVAGPGKFDGTAHFADGTAHTTARAYASGNWGIPKTGPAIVGELGTEGVVRDGKFFTIGDNGAEVVNLKKGDVVFNHLQVRELLEKGHVTSNGGRARLVGAAYADGTAKNGMRAFVNVKPSGGGSRHITKYSQTQVVSKPAQTYNPPAQVSAAPAQAAAKAAEEYKETLDEIEILIDRIERKIDQLDTVGNSSFTVLADRQSALGEEFAKVTEEINIQTQAVQKYQDYANSLGLDAGWAEKIRNGALNIETITDENLHKTIQEYSEWHEKSLDCQDALVELKETLGEIAQTSFDNLSSHFEKLLGKIEHETSLLENQLDIIENRGNFAGKAYYEELVKQQEASMKKMQEQYVELQDQMNEAIWSGAIKEGSEAALEMEEEINGVAEAWQEAQIQLLEYKNDFLEMDTKANEWINGQIDNLHAEADFIRKLLAVNEENLFNKKTGRLTDAGWATGGLHALDYDVYMQQADEYAKKIQEINKAIASDPYNTILIDQKDEYIKLQQESIQAANDEKKAIQSLMSDSYDRMLKLLSELIQKRKDEMRAAKDLYDYERQIEEQTKTISDLKKQYLSLAGDDSEEAGAKRQEVSEQLKNAEKDLEASEYDQYLKDQEILLDGLYDESERIFNERLDDIDGLLREQIDYANANAENILDTISTSTTEVGYKLSADMQAIWNTTDSGIGKVLSDYTAGFSNNFTTVDKYIKGIFQILKETTKSKVEVEKPKPTTQTKPKPAPAPAKPSAPAKKQLGGIGSMFRADGKPIYWDSYGTVGPYGSQQYFGSDPVYVVEGENNGYVLGRWYKSPGGAANAAGWFRKSDVTALETGGYTGNSEGMAMLHKKERVLSAQQTQAFEKLVYDILPGLTDSFIQNSSIGAMGKAIQMQSGDVNQNISVQFNLPNVTDEKSLIEGLQDRKVQDYLTSLVLDPLSGKAKLNKNKFKR